MKSIRCNLKRAKNVSLTRMHPCVDAKTIWQNNIEWITRSIRTHTDFADKIINNRTEIITNTLMWLSLLGFGQTSFIFTTSNRQHIFIAVQVHAFAVVRRSQTCQTQSGHSGGTKLSKSFSSKVLSKLPKKHLTSFPSQLIWMSTRRLGRLASRQPTSDITDSWFRLRFFCYVYLCSIRWTKLAMYGLPGHFLSYPVIARISITFQNWFGFDVFGIRQRSIE